MCNNTPVLQQCWGVFALYDAVNVLFSVLSVSDMRRADSVRPLILANRLERLISPLPTWADPVGLFGDPLDPAKDALSR